MAHFFSLTITLVIDSNFMIRKGFNFGCNLLEIEGPIEKCQSACNTRPDCLSFQHTAGKCSLKNCVTDTVMKGIFGEDFHVKGNTKVQ